MLSPYTRPVEHDAFDIAAFGRGIIRRREALGWSSHRLASKASLADPYVRKLETGRGVRLGVDVVLRLAHALGVAPEELLSDAGVPTSAGLARELGDVYRDLGPAERRALVRMGRTLRELQTEYESRQRSMPDGDDDNPVLPYEESDEPVDIGNLAAHSNKEEAAEGYRDAMGWTDEEQP